MENIIIETKNLSFNEIIKYNDIKIIQHKSNFIIGKSGSGKSTLLRLFNGTMSPSSGTVFYSGKDINDIYTINLRQEVLLVSQSVYLFDATIRENFNHFYDYRELTPPSEEKMKYFLDLCCVPFSLDIDCTTMSGGERQRVYIAIFLSFNPDVLMLDEPTSALDRQSSVNVMENVLTYCGENGITSVVVSHDANITEKFAENIIMIGEDD